MLKKTTKPLSVSGQIWNQSPWLTTGLAVTGATVAAASSRIAPIVTGTRRMVGHLMLARADSRGPTSPPLRVATAPGRDGPHVVASRDAGGYGPAGPRTRG